MKSFIIIILMMFLSHSCNYNRESKSVNILTEDQLNNLLSNGHIDSLLNNDDTLQIFLNLSSCMSRRYDKIKFYRKSDSVYIQPEIKITFDKEEIVQGLEKKYSILKNDSLSFENFISEIHRTLPTIQDTLKEKRGFMSIGVQKKWGKKYYSESMTEENFQLTNKYLRIMNRIYPEIEEYRPIKIQITEDE